MISTVILVGALRVLFDHIPHGYLLLACFLAVIVVATFFALIVKERPFASRGEALKVWASFAFLVLATAGTFVIGIQGA